MVNLLQIKETKSLFDNHYQFIDKIGGGGFSEVWLAHDTIADIDVALKIYTPNGELDEEGKNDFKKEFARLCDLNHSNIIHAIGFGIYKNELPYLAMSVCKNGSAKNLIKKASEEEIWKFLRDVISGLAYLHKKGIVHQDMKPDNVLINSDGQYLIIDFGISTKTRNTLRKSEKGSIGGGTPWYMSIESWGTESPSIFARDIWALGATLYEIVTGEVPFGQYGGVTQKSKNGKIPQIKQTISDELKQLIYDCLALEAWDRPDAEQIIQRVKDHYEGIEPPRKVPWKILVACSFAIMVIVGIYTQKDSIIKLFKDNPTSYAQNNPNDSLYIAHLDKTLSIVRRESNIILQEREVEKMQIGKLTDALDEMKSFMNLEDSISNEDIKKTGKQKIDSINTSIETLSTLLKERGDQKIAQYDDFGKEAQTNYYNLSDSICYHAKYLTNK